MKKSIILAVITLILTYQIGHSQETIITVTPASYDFGFILMHECSDDIPFIISNTGNEVANGSLDLIHWLNYSMSPNSSFSLNPGQSLTVFISFCPATGEGFINAINITGNFNTVNVNLSASSHCLEIISEANPPEGGSTSPLSYIVLGEDWTQACFDAITNPGYEFVDWEYDGMQVSLEAYYCNDYENCSLDPYLLTANFQPSASPFITVSPESYDWGTICEYQSYTVPFTITNYGNSQAEFVIPTSTMPPVFFVISGFGTHVLNPGETHTFDVDFDPGDAASYQATLNIDGIGQTNDLAIDLEGSNVWEVPVGVFPIPGEGGTVSGGGSFCLGDECCISAIPNPGYVFDHWEIIPFFGSTIISYEQDFCFTIDVVYGDYSCLAHFLDVSQIPHLTVIPDTYDFGLVEAEGGASYIFELVNDGGVTANGYIPFDSPSYYFYVSMGWGNFSLAPGQSHFFEISFEPIENVGYSTTITIDGYGDCNDATVDVSGQGVIYIDVTTEPYPANAGSTIGDNIYIAGEESCINAFPNPGYVFYSWVDYAPAGNDIIYTPEHCYTTLWFHYEYNWHANFYPFEFQLKVFLSGCFNGIDMDPYPDPGTLPLNQPYNTEPWYYNGDESVSSMPNGDVVDWVLVELRDPPGGASTALPSTSVGMRAAFLLSDGSIADLDGSSNLSFNIPTSSNFHVVIWHRNHLGIMSAYPLTGTSIPYEHIFSYDFTDNQYKAHGADLAQKEIASGVWGMIGGDYDASGEINEQDKTAGWNNEAGNSVYLNSDFNLDGEVENKDKNDIWWPNLNSFSTVPLGNYIYTETDYILMPYLSFWMSIDVFSNVSWTVSNPNPEWLTVTPLTGTGNMSINLGCPDYWEFTARSCTLTFSGDGIIYELVVEQEGYPFCSIDPINNNVGSEAGSYIVDVTSNGYWSIEYDCFPGDWITVSPESGSGNGAFTVNFTQNSTGEVRCCQLYVFYESSSGVGIIEYVVHTICQDVDQGMFSCGDLLLDPRDNRSYETVQIGSQCWMAENLNYGTMINTNGNQIDDGITQKYCYNNDENSCTEYGANYQWDELMDYQTIEGSQGICPDNWHVPTDEEWKVLEGTADGTFGYPHSEWDLEGWRGNDAGGNLKEMGLVHWDLPNTGAMDLYDFSARASGYYNFELYIISGQGMFAQFWTSSKDQGSDNIYLRGLRYDRMDIRRVKQSIDFGLSLRCIKD